MLFILAKKFMFYDRTKHIDVKYHFIRIVISKGIFKIGKVSTQFNPSNMGTKVNPMNKFETCIKLLSVDSM